MKRNRVAFASMLGATGVLLAACGGEPGPAGNNSGNGSDSAANDPSFHVMQDWQGCEALDDLQVLQDYLGVVKVEGDGLQSDGIGEGLDAAGAGCNARFELATFEFDVAGTSGSSTGESTVYSGIVAWENPDTASEDMQDRIDQRLEDAAGGVKFENQVEGELAGDWDESWYIAGEGQTRYQVIAYGRHGSWLAYISIDVLEDPGRANYRVAPEFYPDQTADDLAVYPFLVEDLADWIANDYMPQIESTIVTKIESEIDNG